MGWQTAEFWECEVNADLQGIVKAIGDKVCAAQRSSRSLERTNGSKQREAGACCENGRGES